MARHVSVRYGVHPLRFLQMALRSDMKSDSVISAMLVIGGTTTGPQIMVVSSMVLSLRQCNEKRETQFTTCQSYVWILRHRSVK